ncbi:hypothetical protein E2C01_044652 [Portunus trituberculatus]|uniref:Uncharacterized protein n=1 Tax=Portunus trituberculatus TaxID=210409 RepID=A0A5B7G0Z5_PORTR|nr:hypothetical protein [Portunus trituberculatus]
MRGERPASQAFFLPPGVLPLVVVVVEDEASASTSSHTLPPSTQGKSPYNLPASRQQPPSGSFMTGKIILFRVSPFVRREENQQNYDKSFRCLGRW